MHNQGMGFDLVFRVRGSHKQMQSFFVGYEQGDTNVL